MTMTRISILKSLLWALSLCIQMISKTSKLWIKHQVCPFSILVNTSLRGRRTQFHCRKHSEARYNLRKVEPEFELLSMMRVTIFICHPQRTEDPEFQKNFPIFSSRQNTHTRLSISICILVRTCYVVWILYGRES